MKAFNLEIGFAKVSNVNHRPELHGEEKELAMDLSITVECRPSILDQLCVDEDCPNYGKFLHDEKGMLINTGLKELKFDRVYEDHELALSFSGVFTDNTTEYFKEVKIKDIKAKPLNGNLIALSFKAQLNPPERDITKLTECIIKPCYIGINGPSQLDLLAVI